MWWMPLMMIIPGTRSSRRIRKEFRDRTRAHFIDPEWQPGAYIWDGRLLRGTPPDRQPPRDSGFGKGEFRPADVLRRRYPGRRIRLPALPIDLDSALHQEFNNPARWPATLAAVVDAAHRVLVLIIALDAAFRHPEDVP